MSEIENSIKRYVEDELIMNDQITPLDMDYPLLENGVIDSASLVSLVTFLEVQFRIQIPGTDLVPEHFESIHSIADYVKSITA